MHQDFHHPSLKPRTGPVKKVVIFLHGYGAMGGDLLSIGDYWQPYLPHTLFLAPHAPFEWEVSTLGRQWFSIADWHPEKSWDPQILARRAEAAMPYLTQLISDVLNTHHLNHADLALVGFSQGAMMAMQWALASPQSIAGVVAYSGALLWSGQPMCKPPMALIHGEQDMRVPFQALSYAATLLKQLNVPYEAHAIPDLDHGIDEQGLKLGLSFLKKYL